MKRQLNITAFTKTKRNKTDSFTSENVSIDQTNLLELPLTSKNDTNNYNRILIPNCNNNMSNDSDKALIAMVNNIGNYVHNLKIDDLKIEKILKTPWVPHLTYIFLLKPKEIYDFNYLR